MKYETPEEVMAFDKGYEIGKKDARALVKDLHRKQTVTLAKLAEVREVLADFQTAWSLGLIDEQMLDRVNHAIATRIGE